MFSHLIILNKAQSYNNPAQKDTGPMAKRNQAVYCFNIKENVKEILQSENFQEVLVFTGVHEQKKTLAAAVMKLCMFFLL